MMLRHLFLTVAAMAVCLGATQASADIWTDSDTTGMILTDFSETLSVDQFDSSWGTLTQVKLTVSGDLEGGGGFENFNSYAVDDSFRYTLDQALDVTWVSGGLLGVSQNLDNTIPVNVPAYDGVLDFAGASGYTEPAYTQGDSQIYTFTLPADLAAFIGTGTVDFDADAVATSSHWPPNGVVTKTYSLGQATVEVEYTYTPIPEPATLGILGMGLLALLLRRKTR